MGIYGTKATDWWGALLKLACKDAARTFSLAAKQIPSCVDGVTKTLFCATRKYDIVHCTRGTYTFGVRTKREGLCWLELVLARGHPHAA